MRVAVLMGGPGAERAVSLVTGGDVADALERLGHAVARIDLDREVARRLLDARPDAVFNALHGTPGEDGSVQGMLDLMGLPYTHSGITASVIAIDKQLTKTLLQPLGIRMPGGRVVRSDSVYEGDPLPRPYVLKPVNEGSSVGVAIVTAEGNMSHPIGRETEGPWRRFDTLLAEPFVPGRELTTAVLGTGEEARALGVTELRTGRGFYDYDAKYTAGLTEHVFPAPVPPAIAAACSAMAVAAHRALGCRGVSRADFRWDDAAGEEGLYLLEVNTQPGMTPLSLVPEQARGVGIDFDALVAAILAQARHDGRSDPETAQ